MNFSSGVNEQVVIIVSIGLGVVVLLTAIILLLKRARKKKAGTVSSEKKEEETELPQEITEGTAMQSPELERIRLLEEQLAQKTLEAEQLKAKYGQIKEKLKELQLQPQGQIVHTKAPVALEDTRRILVVDDNEKALKEAEELLRKMDYKTETAANGFLAFRMVQDSAPRYYDLILMDAIMPEMDGYETAAKIRALNRADVKRIPIVTMAANTFGREHRLSEKANIDGSITKPLNEKELARSMQRYLPFDVENFNYII